MSSEIYITAAFRSIHKHQAYIFMKTDYVLVDYKPNQKDDKILYGPARIRDAFSSLRNTVFGNEGIDCAFGSHNPGEAFIFSGNQCAKWFYAPNSTNDRILKGPMYIADMFPFLRGTVFENGVDAAFESCLKFEAYLFKGNQYARINYGAYGHLITIAPIRKYWPCLRGTIFQNGFDAAFALHTENEAYLFKEDCYGRIRFTPGATWDELRWWGEIKDSWTNLGSILPRKNYNYN